MNRYIPVFTLIAFVCGVGAAYAGGGGAAADRLRDPNARGLNLSVKQYNSDMKKRRVRGQQPGQMQGR